MEHLLTQSLGFLLKISPFHLTPGQGSMVGCSQKAANHDSESASKTVSNCQTATGMADSEFHLSGSKLASVGKKLETNVG
jgi:hypothetical protein